MKEKSIGGIHLQTRALGCNSPSPRAKRAGRRTSQSRLQPRGVWLHRPEAPSHPESRRGPQPQTPQTQQAVSEGLQHTAA
jgi:hypothetical protein